MSQSSSVLQELSEREKRLNSEAVKKEINIELRNTSQPTNYDNWLKCFSEVLTDFEDIFTDET